MNTLLNEVLQWLQMNNYHRASFDRLVGIIPSAATYEQLHNLVDAYPAIFRHASMKGGLPGLALQDGVEAADALLGETTPPDRVTIDEIEACIVDTAYLHPGAILFRAPGDPLNNLTICIITLDNGFTVVGKSACVDPRLYDEQKGRELAREDAVRQVWAYLGFRLADRRFNR